MAVFFVHVPAEGENRPCHRSMVHGEVLCRDDTDDLVGYDEDVLGDVPNGHQYGYCKTCRAPFHWSGLRFRWVPWDRSRWLSISFEDACDDEVRWPVEISEPDWLEVDSL